MNAQDYYAVPEVRKRIVEFLGGDSLDSATSVFIAHGSVGLSRRIYPQPVNSIDTLLNEGLDIARSLWDYNSLLLHLDIEYVNFDFASMAYLDQERTFLIQQPVIQEFQKILGRFGIDPLHLLSGRGHHLIWKIDRGSTAYNSLLRIGQLPLGIEQFYHRHEVLPGIRVDESLARVYSGLGMLMEFLTNTVIKNTTSRCEIPVTISDLEVAPQKNGRETISIDISEYSDPLSTRMIRIAYSVYTKAIKLNVEEPNLQLLYFVPLNGLTIKQGIATLQSPELASQLAINTSAVIPNFTEETTQLIDFYNNSYLAHFHRYFYSEKQMLPHDWNATYDLANLSGIPQCIKSLVVQPGKKLLRPAAMQLVVRSLYALGWHPNHIAGLVRSKFERDHGWGEEWEFYYPPSRADFYIRALAGAIATKADVFSDFNCQDLKGKGYCLESCNDKLLNELRDAALERRLP